MSSRLWKQLGFSGLRLEINSLGETDTRSRYRAALIDFLEKHETELDEDSRKRMHANPLRVLDSKVPATRKIVEGAPSILDFLDDESAEHFAGLRAGLDALGIEYVVNPRLVRGLDYYTRSVFEWMTEDLGAQGTICAGGRYDRLVEQLGGSPTPAAGWACGVERLVLLLKQQANAAHGSQADIYLCCFGEQGTQNGLTLAERLRDAMGPKLRLALNLGGGKPAAQLRRADRSGAEVALVLGDDEAAAGQVQVKFLRQDRPQAVIPQTEIARELASMFAGRSQ